MPPQATPALTVPTPYASIDVEVAHVLDDERHRQLREIAVSLGEVTGIGEKL
jgi:hypothetical protein